MRPTVYNDIAQRVPLKVWNGDGKVAIEPDAIQQARNVCTLPFVMRHVALMPDAHFGKGSTIGSVIPTKGAIIPAAVGVDLGCGMMAVRTPFLATDLPDTLAPMRSAIEQAVPHGRTDEGGSGDRGAWGNTPEGIAQAWRDLVVGYELLANRHPFVRHRRPLEQLGTLGTGNHFIEVCLDEAERVWVMLHSGSRGPGNKIGTYFIQKARDDMRRWFINLPDQDLAYLPEGSLLFDDYLDAVMWAQKYALTNRVLMMAATLNAVCATLRPNDDFQFELGDSETAVNCHHNYVARESHFGENVLVTRKGAVRAREGDLGIIPGSMGAKSFIVRGKGNADSFHSCSHGAGRAMSRTEAKRRFTVEDHAAATAGVECRKDKDVLDETPGAYKSIDDVIAAQEDLIEVVHTLRQVLCVKG